MKIVKDVSIFEKNPPRLTLVKDGCSYFWRKKTNYSSFYAMPVPLSWNMYCVTGIYEEEILAGCHFCRENPGFFAIEYIKSGSLYVRQEGRMYLAEPGDIVLLFPGCHHELLTGPEGNCIKSSVLFTGPLLDMMLEQSGLKKVDILTGKNGNRFEKLLNLLKSLSVDFGGIAREQIISLSYETIQFLLSQETSKLLPEKLSSFLSLLDENIECKFTLNDLASKYGCSAPHLNRLFHTYLNTTPHRMLIRLRMRVAVRFLLEDSLSIKEIAQKSGYENAFNFSTEFRKNLGVSPRAFRQARPH